MFFELKSFLEKIDGLRDKMLFNFIKEHWPRWILPNHLTIIRIVLAILLIYLFLNNFQSRLWLIIIFLVASLLDLFDGSVARTLNKVTRLGALLDIVADKILILPIAVFILIEDHFWLLFYLILPELLSGLVVIYYKAAKRVIQANIFGKTKMVIECVAFALIILFNFPDSPSQFSIILLYFGVLFAFLNLISNFTNPAPKIND